MNNVKYISIKNKKCNALQYYLIYRLYGNKIKYYYCTAIKK